MKWLRALTRPYYFYRPSQIVRRLRYAQQPKPAPSGWVELPWGHRLWVNPADDLGDSLNTAGINDLMVSESIFRLLQPGETAVDVGANLGYTTSAMTARVHRGGKVWSFEPHPQLFQELSRQVADWQAHGVADTGEVRLVNAAVSDKAGTARLIEPANFLSNRGLSRLEAADASPALDHNAREYPTDVVTLDDVLAAEGAVHLLKVDVEGHEEAVFTGAKALFDARRIRHILYEEFRPYPAPTHRLLERHGYEIFVVEEHLLGPRLVTVGSPTRFSEYAPPNYLATLDQRELRRRFAPWGWKCLRP